MALVRRPCVAPCRGALHSVSTIWSRQMSVGATENIFNHRITHAPDHAPRPSGSRRSKGPLAAWTVSIKDNICTRDMPTTCSSAMLQAYTSPFDATVVQLLRNAGAHIVGKTNCDEFGMGSSNVHSVNGAVRNPMGREDEEARVAGGSSGGAAASVAAKMCRVAIGSDTGGSVRLPAAYCGVYGFKPSYGLLSRWGLVSYADSLDTIGIMTSRSKDIPPVFDVLSKYDDNDPTSVSMSVRQRAEGFASKSVEHVGRTSLDGLRVGVPQEWFAREVNERVMPAVRQALSTLRSLGADVVPVHVPSAKYALSAYYVLASAEASSNLARYDGIRYGQRAPPPTAEEKQQQGFARHIARTRSSTFGEEVKKRLLLGTYALTSDLFDNYFVQAQKVRQLVRRDLDKVFCIANALEQSDAISDKDRNSKGVHVLLHPSAVDIAPTMIEAQNDDGIASYTQDLLTVPASLAGIPSISVPLGTADGMPVGITLTTQWGCESVLWRILQHLGP